MAEYLETISVQDYMTTVLPEQLAAQSFTAPAGMEDATYAVQYNVAGTQYATRVTGSQVEVVPGSVENPLIAITLDEAGWRSSITGETAAADAMVDPTKMTSSRLEKLRSTKGKFNLELTKDDGMVVNSTTVFNSTETPEVTLMMKADDYAKILRGELNSQMAFMTGKLKFKGDMNFLMKLGGLM